MGAPFAFCVERSGGRVLYRGGFFMDNTQRCIDAVWQAVRAEAEEVAAGEPLLARLADEVVLSRGSIFESVGVRLSRKLGRNAIGEGDLYAIFMDAFSDDESIRRNIVYDIAAIKSRDPACTGFLNPILYYKGFMSISAHRVSHWLWNRGRKSAAHYIQSICIEIFGVDIHPAARFGGGILLDHATSFVAGETSVVEDNVSILHEVTLGGTGKAGGDRHPKVMSGVLIGAGAKLIGNIKIGTGAKIGAGSVVLDDVEPHTTVVGVPARPVASDIEDVPASEMNQQF